MSDYIDGFIFPIHRDHIEEYKSVASKVAEIWKEYGALAYVEFVGDDLKHEGLRSFVDLIDVPADEKIIFGWATFPNKTIRDKANAGVPQDPRIAKLVEPIMDESKKIFDASRMVYGGFELLVNV